MPKRVNKKKYKDYEERKYFFDTQKALSGMTEFGSYFNESYKNLEPTASDALMDAIEIEGKNSIYGMNATSKKFREQDKNLIKQTRTAINGIGRGIQRYNGPFKEMFEAEYYVYNPNNGSMLDLLIDHPTMHRVINSFSAMPVLLDFKKVKKNVPDPKKKGEFIVQTEFQNVYDKGLAERRKKALGNVYPLLNNYYKSVSEFVKVLYERQKDEADNKMGLDKKYSAKYSNAIDKMVNSFELLREESIRRNADEKLSPEQKNFKYFNGSETKILNSPLDEITSADLKKPNRNYLNAVMANYKAQSKAIKNGWKLEYAQVIGTLAEAVTELENVKEELDYNIQQTQNTIEELKNKKDADEKNAESLEKYANELNEYNTKREKIRKALEETKAVYEKYSKNQTSEYFSERGAFLELSALYEKYKNSDVYVLSKHSFEAAIERTDDLFGFKGKTRYEMTQKMLESLNSVDKLGRSSPNFKDLKSSVKTLNDFVKKHPNMDKDQFREFEQLCFRVSKNSAKYRKGKEKEAEDYARKNKGAEISRSEYTAKRMNTVNNIGWMVNECLERTSAGYTDEYCMDADKRAIAKYERLCEVEEQYRNKKLYIEYEGGLTYHTKTAMQSFYKSMYIERLKEKYDTDPDFTAEDFIKALTQSKFKQGVEEMIENLEDDFKEHLRDKMRNRAEVGFDDEVILDDTGYSQAFILSGNDRAEPPISRGQEWVKFELEYYKVMYEKQAPKILLKNDDGTYSYISNEEISTEINTKTSKGDNSKKTEDINTDTHNNDNDADKELDNGMNLNGKVFDFDHESESDDSEIGENKINTDEEKKIEDFDFEKRVNPKELILPKTIVYRSTDNGVIEEDQVVLNNLTPDIVNSGNLPMLKKFREENGNNLDYNEKKYLDARIKIAQKINLKRIETLEKIAAGEEPVLPQVDNKNGFTGFSNLKYPEYQNSGNGCWSCAYSLLLKSRGVDLNQEEIRGFRPDYKPNTKPEDKASAERQTKMNIDTINSVFENSDLLSTVLPNTGMKQMTFTPFNPDDAKLKGKKMKNTEIDNFLACYKQQTKEKMTQVIYDAIVTDKSPVAVTYQGHYITITGIKPDGSLRCEDSTYGNCTREDLTVDDIIESGFGTGNDIGDQGIQLLWLKDLDVPTYENRLNNANTLHKKEPNLLSTDDAGNVTFADLTKHKTDSLGGRPNTGQLEGHSLNRAMYLDQTNIMSVMGGKVVDFIGNDYRIGSEEEYYPNRVFYKGDPRIQEVINKEKTEKELPVIIPKKVENEEKHDIGNEDKKSVNNKHKVKTDKTDNQKETEKTGEKKETDKTDNQKETDKTRDKTELPNTETNKQNGPISKLKVSLKKTDPVADYVNSQKKTMISAHNAKTSEERQGYLLTALARHKVYEQKTKENADNRFVETYELNAKKAQIKESQAFINIMANGGDKTFVNKNLIKLDNLINAYDKESAMLAFQKAGISGKKANRLMLQNKLVDSIYAEEKFRADAPQNNKNIVKSAFTSLYLQIIRSEYGFKPGDSKKEQSEKERKLSKALSADFSENVSKFIKSLDKSFVKAFTAKVIEGKSQGKVAHHDITYYRDQVLREKYDQFGKNASSRQINKLNKIAKVLGSNVIEAKIQKTKDLEHIL